MREIKFRAWHTVKGKMYSWEYIKNTYTIHALSDKNVVQLKFMQFTGLKDKNGVEIYEGDIVVQDGYIWFVDGQPNYRGTVEWVYSQWQVIQHCINPERRGISDGVNVGLNDDGVNEGSESQWEVVGNIYEHPGLLK